MKTQDHLTEIVATLREHEGLINLLHRMVEEAERTGAGTTLTAIAEDKLVEYYRRHGMKDRLKTKKELEADPSTPLRVL